MMEWLLNIQQAGGRERGGPGVVVQAALWRRTRAARSVSAVWKEPRLSSSSFYLFIFLYLSLLSFIYFRLVKGPACLV